MSGKTAGTPAILPVAIIGAGPIGLAAAVHLMDRGHDAVVLEAGAAPAASLRRWAHVRLFSPWNYLVDPIARRHLEATGWHMPDPEVLPTGGGLLASYVEPLAQLPEIASRIRTNRQVVAVTRYGIDKVKTNGREHVPFELVVTAPDGSNERILSRAVIDASGTWEHPSPLGASGVPARGEKEARDHLYYGIPDVMGRDRARYAGRRTLVVGSGHSAFNAVLDLIALASREPGTDVQLAVRRLSVQQMFGGGEGDQLTARGRLGLRLQELVAAGTVRLETGVRVEAVERVQGALLVRDHTGRAFGPFDEIIVATGYRPDLSMTRELRLRLDPWLEAPEALAPLIDPNVHSCGTVPPHGVRELSHPEHNYFTVGMKSYGRAPTFLLLTGYEQVRSVVSFLVGDESSALETRLSLPTTGVCRTEFAGAAECAR